MLKPAEHEEFRRFWIICNLRRPCFVLVFFSGYISKWATYLSSCGLLLRISVSSNTASRVDYSDLLLECVHFSSDSFKGFQDDYIILKALVSVLLYFYEWQCCKTTAHSSRGFFQGFLSLRISMMLRPKFVWRTARHSVSFGTYWNS